jgi:hypothetical protein
MRNRESNHSSSPWIKFTVEVNRHSSGLQLTTGIHSCHWHQDPYPPTPGSLPHLRPRARTFPPSSARSPVLAFWAADCNHWYRFTATPGATVPPPLATDLSNALVLPTFCFCAIALSGLILVCSILSISYIRRSRSGKPSHITPSNI